ncbi:hypothetical protein J4421_00405 [Candidatus Woesearchaeota archaeon]|nr:hypothetical protein [Candidatus Woesearchaeota archaeon]
MSDRIFSQLFIAGRVDPTEGNPHFNNRSRRASWYYLSVSELLDEANTPKKYL